MNQFEGCAFQPITELLAKSSQSSDGYKILTEIAIKKFKILIFDFFMLYMLPKWVSLMNQSKQINFLNFLMHFMHCKKNFLSDFTADAIK